MIIKAQKGRGSKIHLLLDDEYVITTDVDFWAENFVEDGTDINEEEWQQLLSKINYKKALNKCADILSRRDHSVKELKDKLLKTVDKDSADIAINKFIELGYLDDDKFARNYVDYLYNSKKYSVSHIKQELFLKGISGDIINDIIKEYNFDSVETVVELINKKYYNKLNSDNGREKVISALVRKGFSYGDIKSALNRIENNDND